MHGSGVDKLRNDKLRSDHARPLPQPNQSTASDTSRPLRYIPTGRSSAAMRNFSRFMPRGPVPPPLPIATNASGGGDGGDADGADGGAGDAYDDEAIPLSMGDDAPFVAAKKTVPTNNVPSRYFQKLRIAAPASKIKSKEDNPVSHSKAIAIKKNDRWPHARRRRVSAPPPSTRSARRDASVKRKDKSKDSVTAAKPKIVKKAVSIDNVELDMGLMFGEEDSADADYYNTNAADSFDDDDSLYRYNRSPSQYPTKNFDFIPSHHLEQRRPGTDVTDSTEDGFAADSDNSSQFSAPADRTGRGSFS